jgi:hypothetical protein
MNICTRKSWKKDSRLSYLLIPQCEVLVSLETPIPLTMPPDLDFGGLGASGVVSGPENYDVLSDFDFDAFLNTNDEQWAQLLGARRAKKGRVCALRATIISLC